MMSICLSHPVDPLLQGMALTSDAKRARAELTLPHTFEYAQEPTLCRSMLTYNIRDRREGGGLVDGRATSRWTAMTSRRKRSLRNPGLRCLVNLCLHVTL